MRTDNNIEERLKTGAGGVNKIGIKKKENEKRGRKRMKKITAEKKTHRLQRKS